MAWTGITKPKLADLSGAQTYTDWAPNTPIYVTVAHPGEGPDAAVDIIDATTGDVV